MARGRPAPGSGGGGERIPSLRPPLSAASVAFAALAGALSAFSSTGAAGAAAEILAGIGLVALSAALLLRFPALIGPALALLGAAYAVSAAGRGGVDLVALAVAPALLLAAELGYWALEAASPLHEATGLTLRRLLTVLLLAALASAAAAFLLASAELDAGGGIALLAAGAAAATGVLALVARLARRGAGSL